MLQNNVCTSRTSSVGRLFDGLASILGLRQRAEFEGQAAMDLEFAAGDVTVEEVYPIPFRKPVLDWGPMVEAAREDVAAGVPLATVAARVHESLAESVVAVARACDLGVVALSGGCFQNRRLTERTVVRLGRAGLDPYWHRRVPPNDGGLSLGQIAGAMRIDEGKDCGCA